MPPLPFLKNDKSTPTMEMNETLPNAPSSPVPPSPTSRPRKLQRLKGGSLSIRPAIFDRERERQTSVDSAMDDHSGPEAELGRSFFGRPRGSSIGEGGTTPEKKRGWFSRKVQDDESSGGDYRSGGGSSMVISSPIPPTDGQPIKSPKAIQDLMELQRQVRAVTLSSEPLFASGSDNRSTDSIHNPPSPLPPRPFTPPNTSEPSEFPTPLSPPRRPSNRAIGLSPRITPLVYTAGTPTSASSASDPNSMETLSPRKVSDSSNLSSFTLGSSRKPSDSSTAPTVASEILASPLPDRNEFFNPTSRSLSPSTNGVKDIAWLNRRPSAGNIRRKPVPEAGPAVDLTDDTPTLRSVPQMESQRSSPVSSHEISTDEKTEDDSEEAGMSSSSGLDDASVGVRRTPRASAMTKVPESRTPSTNGLGESGGMDGYLVEVVCADPSGKKWVDGELKEGEEIRWEVVIRKTTASNSLGRLSFASAPIPVSDTTTSVSAPSSASSINLSLSLDRPTGKLVFISLPTDPQITPIKRRPSARAPSTTRSEHSPSSSPSASSPSRSTFPDTFGPGGATPYPTPPASASSIPTSPRSPATNGSGPRRQNPTPSIGSVASPPLNSSSTLTSPPSSPRDVSQRRRKASLQGGVLFTPKLDSYE